MQSDRGAVTVAEVMTSRVQTGTPEQPLSEIWQTFREHRCHHVPIVDGARLVGMVSSRDLIRVAHERGLRRLSEDALEGLAAADVMSRAVERVERDVSVDVAIDRIGRGDLHALVVVHTNGELAGIVTHNDLLSYLMG